MRLWSIHPQYLDTVGLLALWREALLAQKVLKGKTKGFVNHPQLNRFKNQPYPKKAISAYLKGIFEESTRRGYNFNERKIGSTLSTNKIKITRGQLEYELELLRKKLKKRNPGKYKELLSVKRIKCHPFFKIKEGSIEEWEKIGLEVN